MPEPNHLVCPLCKRQTSAARALLPRFTAVVCLGCFRRRTGSYPAPSSTDERLAFRSGRFVDEEELALFGKAALDRVSAKRLKPLILRFLPELEDEVVVVFELGETRTPVVLGVLWSGSDKPPE